MIFISILVLDSNSFTICNTKRIVIVSLFVTQNDFFSILLLDSNSYTICYTKGFLFLF